MMRNMALMAPLMCLGLYSVPAGAKDIPGLDEAIQENSAPRVFSFRGLVSAHVGLGFGDSYSGAFGVSIGGGWRNHQIILSMGGNNFDAFPVTDEVNFDNAGFGVAWRYFPVGVVWRGMAIS